MHSTSLFSTPWPFWTGILSQVSKNDDEKNVASYSNLALTSELFRVYLNLTFNDLINKNAS